MLSNKIVKMVFATIVLAGCFILLFQYMDYLISPKPDLVTTTDIKGLPLRITVPSIGVDAAIEKMGVAKDGSMESPKGPDNAGWYKLGPRPGEIGSAVIDGHFGWIGGIPAVFDKLSQLKKGDKISIKDNHGKVLTFVVASTTSYAWDADFTNVFKSTDGKAHLNLITCGGTWNTYAQNYTQRFVVFADLVI